MSQLLRPFERIEAELSGSTWRALWPRLAVAILNFNVALIGTTMFLGVQLADANAPWAPEMRTFGMLTVWPALGGLAILLLASVVLGLRGRPQFIVPVSILGLGLPLAEGYAYRWYLWNVAEGTISGPAGLGLAVGAAMIFVFGVVQAAVGGLFLVYRWRLQMA